MNAKFPQRLLCTTAALLVGTLSALPAAADDVEIYTGSAGGGNGTVQPNVLLILDTSGSMSTTVDDLDSTTTNLSRMQNMQIAVKTLLDNLSNVNVGLMRFTDVGGPILFPVADLDADANVIENGGSAAANVVNTRITAVNDDAEENLDNTTSNPINAVRLNDTNLVLGNLITNTGTTCPFGSLTNVSNPLGSFVGSTGSSSNIFKANATGEPANTCTIWQSTATAYDYGVINGSNSNDCRGNSNNCNDIREQDLGSGSVNTGTSLDFDSSQINALRFTDLAIPRGARIVDAHITYKAKGSDSGDNIVHYFGQTDAMNTTGAAQSGSTSSTIKLALSSSATTNFYNNATITITSGTGAGQVRTISAYNGGTKVATVSSNWTTTPDTTSQYAINSKVPFVLGNTSDISHRAAVAGTTASVAWDMPDWNSGTTYTTPDLSPIVQEIVCSGVNTFTPGAALSLNYTDTVSGSGGCPNPPGLPATAVNGWSPPTAIFGTAQSGSSSSTIKLATTASGTNNFYTGMTITITSGTGKGQSKTIGNYSGSTKVATINPPGTNWATTPDNTSVYAISNFPSGTATNALANTTLDTMVESTKTSMTGDKGNDDGALIGVLPNAVPVPAGDMVFMTTHDGPTSRSAYTEAGAGSTVSNHPVLDVTFEPGPWDVNQNEKVGLRFTNVGIPQGATITSATIEFTASKQTITNPATNISIRGELASDSAAFTTASDNINGRTKTASVALWNPASGLTDWVPNTAYSSPELKTVVQEIVNQSGWCGNNHMTFLVHRIGTTGDTRFFYSADADPSKAPILHVTYDASSIPAGGGCINAFVTRQISLSADDADETDSTHSVSTNSSSLNLRSGHTEGMRFEKVNIPRNTTILTAKIIYTSNSSQTGTVSDLVYHGELIGDSPAFSSSNGNISNRTLTAASVTQASQPNWSSGESDSNTTSPDLKTIIQEIVNQATWNPFQSLSIIANGAGGSGKRQPMSADVSPAQAPLLQIQVQWGGSVLPPVITTVRDRLKQEVDGLSADGYTPIVSTLYEASQYFRGQAVVWGKQRSHISSSQPNTRVSNSASWTGGTLVRPTGCTDANINSSTCSGEHITGSPTYISPITSDLSCATNHIVFLTDGIANHNDTENGVDHGLSLVQSQVGSTCRTSTNAALGDTTTGNTIIQGEQCGRELVNWLHTHDLSPLTGTQRLDNFYGVGFNLCNDTPAFVSGKLQCCVAGTVTGGSGTVQSPATSCTLAQDPSSVRFLKDMVKASGGDPNTQYTNAFTATDLTAFFKATFADILAQQSSFVAPSLAANAFNRLFSRNEVYFGLFTPQLNVRWNGNVKKYRICDDPTTGCTLGDVLDLNGNQAVGTDGLFKTTSRNLWTGSTPYVESNGQSTVEGGAGGELTDYTQRVIYTETTNSGTAPTSGTPLDQVGFRITSSASDYNVAGAQPIRNATCANPALNDATCNSLLLWMLGQDVKDENGDGSTTDTRWSFNDVLHSSPIVVTYGKDTGTGNFIDKVLVGTNEGGLRMLNGLTGAEDWTFMPQAVLGNQQSLFADAQGNRIYGLDDTPTVREIDNNGDGIIDPSAGDKVIVYIAMRRGGNHIYALDITPPSTLTNVNTKVLPKFLWRIDGGSANFPRLAETWSKPQSVDILTTTAGVTSKTPVLIFAGGYDAALENGFGNLQPDPTTGQTMPNPNNGNAIYIVNADTGALIMSISGSAGASIVVPKMTYAIPSDVATEDTVGDGAVDRLYVGDTGGQLWRVDLKDVSPGAANPAGNSVVGLLASVSTPATLSKQRRFFYPPSVVQVKDSLYSNAVNGEYDYVLIPTGNRGHPLDTNISDRFYAFRDTTTGLMADNNSDHLADNYPVTGGTPISETNMIDITNRIFTPTDSDLTTIQQSLGWFYVFPATGEKGLSAPVTLANTVVFTSYLPQFNSGNPCSANAGSGQAYNFNILTTAANYNWNLNGTTGGTDLGDRSQILGTGIPSEVVPIFTGNGVTLLIGTGGGAQNLGKVLDLPRFRTYWYQEE